MAFPSPLSTPPGTPSPPRAVSPTLQVEQAHEEELADQSAAMVMEASSQLSLHASDDLPAAQSQRRVSFTLAPTLAPSPRTPNKSSSASSRRPENGSKMSPHTPQRAVTGLALGDHKWLQSDTLQQLAQPCTVWRFSNPREYGANGNRKWAK